MSISITHENIGKKVSTTINTHLYIPHAGQIFILFFLKKGKNKLAYNNILNKERTKHLDPSDFTVVKSQRSFRTI
jgi:hypothetical protein